MPEKDGAAIRRANLAEFLMQRRTELLPGPDEVRKGRRRIRGLRREELAKRCGISVGWLQKLEQAQQVNPSRETLQRLAMGLQLDEVQFAQLLSLAAAEGPVRAPRDANETLDALVTAYEIYPAYIQSNLWDVVCANGACQTVFGMLEAAPWGTPNIVWSMFTSATLKEMIVDWEGHARRVLAQFRADAQRERRNPSVQEMVSKLSAASAEFREWWPTSVSLFRGVIRKTINHPEIGLLRMLQTSWAEEPISRHKLVVYTPVTSMDYRKLVLLREESQASTAMVVGLEPVSDQSLLAKAGQKATPANEQSFRVGLSVQATNRIGLLRDITTVIAHEGVDIDDVRIEKSCKSTSKNRATVTLTLILSSLGTLSRITSGLVKVPSIEDVTREPRAGAKKRSEHGARASH